MLHTSIGLLIVPVIMHEGNELSNQNDNDQAFADTIKKVFLDSTLSIDFS